MLSRAEVFQSRGRWMVRVTWGWIVEIRGPYRYRWQARLVAWLNEDLL